MKLYKMTNTSNDNQTMFATTDREEFKKKARSLLMECGGTEFHDKWLNHSDIMEHLMDLSYEFTIDKI